jgi:transcriptional regulator with XRE-family HTH domain
MKRETFGQKMKRLRKDAGLTQQQLAGKLGLTKAYISQLETGHRGDGIRGVGLKLACQIAEALGTSVREMEPTQ